MAIKIFIDQGHNPAGNFNSGSAAMGLDEGNITYIIGTYLAKILKDDARFSVLTSRTCITQVVGYNNDNSLEQRVNLANTWGANYFLSIHCNFSNIQQSNGTEIYVYKSPSVAYNLAQSLLSYIVNALKTTNRGVKIDPSYYVLKHTTMPACLIETAFISNPQDAIKLQEQAYTFAVAIYQGLVNYLFS